MKYCNRSVTYNSSRIQKSESSENAFTLLRFNSMLFFVVVCLFVLYYKLLYQHLREKVEFKTVHISEWFSIWFIE